MLAEAERSQASTMHTHAQARAVASQAELSSLQRSNEILTDASCRLHGHWAAAAADVRMLLHELSAADSRARAYEDIAAELLASQADQEARARQSSRHIPDSGQYADRLLPARSSSDMAHQPGGDAPHQLLQALALASQLSSARGTHTGSQTPPTSAPPPPPPPPHPSPMPLHALPQAEQQFSPLVSPRRVPARAAPSFSPPPTLASTAVPPFPSPLLSPWPAPAALPSFGALEPTLLRVARTSVEWAPAINEAGPPSPDELKREWLERHARQAAASPPARPATHEERGGWCRHWNDPDVKRREAREAAAAKAARAASSANGRSPRAVLRRSPGAPASPQKRSSRSAAPFEAPRVVGEAARTRTNRPPEALCGGAVLVTAQSGSPG